MTAAQDAMIVVMKVQDFELEQTGPYRLNIPIVLNFRPMIGYLPVYASLEDAKRDFPDGPFQEIALKEAPLVKRD